MGILFLVEQNHSMKSLSSVTENVPMCLEEINNFCNQSEVTGSILKR